MHRTMHICTGMLQELSSLAQMNALRHILRTSSEMVIGKRADTQEFVSICYCVSLTRRQAERIM